MSEGALPVLYSFRRCPYAMRARMALYVSGTQCELREVVLSNKPAAMLKTSPKGTVPVLKLQSGQVLEESLDVMTWALAQNDPETWLIPETETSAAMMALIAKADTDFKHNLDRYKYPDRYEGADAIAYRTAGEKFLKQLDDRTGHQPYLFGNRLCLADVAIAPFVRQFANTDRGWFDQTPYLNLHRWLDAFLQSETFNIIMEKYLPWQSGDPVTLSPVP